MKKEIEKMLGTQIKETTKHHNHKLIRAYHNAYASYNAACDRYDRLLQAYKILHKFKEGKPADARSGAVNNDLPYTMKVMRGMIEEAHKEKSIIAGHARECIRHLRTLQYEM